MRLPIYKPGQGYWTRTLTAVGAGMLLLAGAVWLFQELQAVPDAYRTEVRFGIPIALLLVGAGVLALVLNTPKIVDFMIATEAEMKKVNWPTRGEIIASTWLVICGTAFMAGLLFAADLVFAWFFRLTGVLQG